MRQALKYMLRAAGLLLICGVLGACRTNPPAAAPQGSLNPRLIRSLNFVDFSVIGEISHNGIKRLYREKVQLGSSEPDAYQFLKIASNSEARLRVETVDQYLAARKTGAFPFNTFEISMDSYFENAAIALQFLQQSIPAKASYLSAELLLQLSVKFLSWHQAEEQLMADAASGKTLSDYFKQHKFTLLKIYPDELRFIYEDIEFAVRVAARGDYDHDGFEDALIVVPWSYVGGSGRGIRCFWAAQKSPNQIPVTLTDINLKL